MTQEPEPPLVIQVQAEPKKPRTRRTPATRDADSADVTVPEDNDPETRALTQEPVILVPIVESPQKIRKEDPKGGPPSLDEWQDFIGRIVLKSLANAYLTLMIADAELTPREQSSILLSREDLNEMSAPLASLVNKSGKAKKHGRAIIAAADSYEAVLAFLIWMRRVNKIAKKYRKPKPPRQQPVTGYVLREPENGDSGQDDEPGPFGPGLYGGIYNPGTG